MVITKIKRIGSTNRFNVYVDEQYCGIFLDEILATYKLKTDMEVDEIQFKEIKQENDERVAFDLAVSYLEKYNVSEKGLKDYLKRKGFDGRVVLQALAKMREYGFVDDEKFAKNYFESMSSNKGKHAIASKLKEKGISSEIIDELLDEIDEDDELEKATNLANKFVKNRQNDTKCKQKCIAHLIYKGYDYNVAQQATSIALKNTTEEQDDWF